MCNIYSIFLAYCHLVLRTGMDWKVHRLKSSKTAVDFFDQLLYCHLLIQADIYIYMLDTYWRNELIRRKHDNDKDAGRKTQEDFFNNILPLTLLQGFERVV